MPTSHGRKFIVVGIGLGAIISLSLFAFSGVATSSTNGLDNIVSRNISSPAIATDNEYLKECNSCTPTEEDYEELTTFELMAIYPELSGDPLDDNGTEIAANDTGMNGLPFDNNTSLGPALPGNLTGNGTLFNATNANYTTHSSNMSIILDE